MTDRKEKTRVGKRWRRTAWLVGGLLALFGLIELGYGVTVWWRYQQWAENTGVSDDGVADFAKSFAVGEGDTTVLAILPPCGMRWQANWQRMAFVPVQFD